MEKKNIRDCDEFDAELLIKIYPWLENRCKDKDQSVQKIGCSYSSTSYGANEVYELILNKMEEKNQLINIKVIIDRVILKLKPKTLVLALALIHYPLLSKKDLVILLDLAERTLYRRVEILYMTIAYILNKEGFNETVVNFINSQRWAYNELQNLKERRESYKDYSDETEDYEEQE